MQTVTLFDTDISEYIDSIPGVLLTAGEYGQLTITSVPSFEGDNTRGFWDQENPASPFYGSTDLSTYPIKIISNGIETFRGSVLNIATSGSGKTATVGLRTSLHKVIEGGAIYASDQEDGATPSAIVAEILTAYNIPIDAGSFAAASSVYAADGVYLRAAQIFPDQTILQIIQAIAEIGVARISYSGGVVRYDVYYPQNAPDPLYTFSDARDNADGCTLYTVPVIETVQKDKIEGFTVEWVGTPVATEGTDFVAKKTISGPLGGTVQILTFNAATWIGYQWLEYMQRPQRQIRFSVPVEIAAQLQPGYPIGIYYSRWDRTATVDILSINASQLVSAEIVGVTR